MNKDSNIIELCLQKNNLDEVSLSYLAEALKIIKVCVVLILAIIILLKMNVEI